ncbi:unnamed protein product, partial [Coccothraustes coccothraustes]
RGTERASCPSPSSPPLSLAVLLGRCCPARRGRALTTSRSGNRAGHPALALGALRGQDAAN